MNDPTRNNEGEVAYIKIAVLESPFEAQVVEGILREEEIPFLVRSYHDTAYDGIFQMQKGWGEIRAPAPHGPRIKEILSFVRTENHDIEDKNDEP